MAEGDGKVNKGSCLCGAVTFELQGDPLYNVVCHCANCKRQGGSTLHCASIFPKAQYTLLTGADKITRYEDKCTMSTQPLTRTFCSVCGSNVGALTPLNEQIISIPAGIQADAGAGWVPNTEQFLDDKVGWVPELGNIARSFERNPSI